MALFGIQVPLIANPVDPSVIQGAASFQTSGNQLTVIQSSNRAVVDWRSFSIDAGEITEFIQPSVNSAVLNRVRGGGASILNGQLKANGQVFLLNQAGVIIGKSGRIDVGSFVASTLDLDNDQFMAGGNLDFRGNSGEAVINLGKISATGGDIFLISSEVTNSGTLTAPNGTAGLAAGNDVILVAEGEERIMVRTGKGSVTNSGTIRAHVAELKAHGGNVAALAIRNDGRVSASGITRKGGKIYLSARGGRIRNSGTLRARPVAKPVVQEVAQIKIDAGQGGTVEVAGTIDAANETGTGGAILIIGSQINMETGSLIIADGETGGGSIQIGGGMRGLDADIMNARNVAIDSGAVIRADAIHSGDGGTVVVFAEDRLDFGGAVSSQGGANSGDGGFVELSGKNEVFMHDLSAQVDLSAANGRAGTLLLDPIDINIIDGIGGGVSGTSINDGAIIDFLTNTGNLIINTSGSGGNGDITFAASANVTWATASNLTFTADRDFIMSAGSMINATGAGSLQADAARGITLNNGSSITTATGNITLNANAAGTMAGNFTGLLMDNATISTTSGAINVTGKGGTIGGEGIDLLNNARIQSTGSGAVGGVNVTGSSAVGSFGIHLQGGLSGGAALITSNDADIVLNGTGGSGGTVSHGIHIRDGGGVSSTGAGDITISAQSASATFNQAISIDNTDENPANGIAHVRTNTGNISITGQRTVPGSGAGFDIFLRTTGEISSSGGGNITLVGDTFKIDAASKVFSSGALTLAPRSTGTSIGIGGGAGTLNFTTTELGKFQDGFSSITIGDTTNGTGLITVNASTFTDNVTIGSGMGSINVNGQITNTGGTVTLVGSGSTTILTADILTNGFAININDKVVLGADVTLNTTNGGSATGANISVTGAIDADLAANNRDFTANAGTGGTLSLGAIGGTQAINDLSLTAGELPISNAITVGGNITFNTTMIDIGAAITGPGTLTIAPTSGDTTIGIGDGAAGTLNLTNAEIANLSDGFSAITIGTAGIAITETFDGPGLPAWLEIGAGSPTVSGGVLNNLGVNSIVRTVATDFTRDFVAEIDWDRTVASGDISFGLGSDRSNPDARGAVGYPSAVFLAIDNNVEPFPRQAGAGFFGTLRLTFNSATQVLTPEVIRPGQSNLNLGSLDVSDNGFNNTNSQIYVQGGGTLTLDNFTITQGPTGAVDVRGGVFKDNVTIQGGAITVTNLNAGANTASLIAHSGAISDVGDVVIDVTAGSASFTASGNVGASGNVLSVSNGATVAANSSGGGIFLTGGGDLDVGTVGSTAGLTTNGGAIEIATPSGLLDVQQAIQSNGGNIDLRGIGIDLSTATADVINTGAGVVAIMADRNVNMAAGSSIMVENGNLTLSANQQATASTGSFFGVHVKNNALIESTGNGVVNIAGRGGDSGNSHGVFIVGTVRGGTTGTTQISGTSGPSPSNFNYGVGVQGSSAVLTTNGSNLNVTGQGSGAGASNNNIGVAAYFGGNISSGGSGTVTVTGTGGVGTGGANRGIDLASFGANISTLTSGGGNILVTGTGGVGSNSAGIELRSTGLIDTATNGGNLTLVSDSVAIGSDSMITSGGGTLLIKPRTVSTTIGIGGGAGTLNLSTTELSRIQDGFSSITIGDTVNGTGSITVNTANFNDPITIGSGVGTILVNGQITGLGNSSVTLIGSGATTILNDSIVTVGNAITINDSVIVGTGTVVLDTTNGGAVGVGANVSITGNINADAEANARNLTINAGTGGGITFGGSIGATQKLDAFNLTAIALTFSGAVNTDGALDFTAANGITLSGANADFNIGGTVTIDADSDDNGTGIFAIDNAGGSLVSNNNSVSITADQLNLAGSINAGTGGVDLLRSVNGSAITIGGTTSFLNTWTASQLTGTILAGSSLNFLTGQATSATDSLTFTSSAVDAYAVTAVGASFRLTFAQPTEFQQAHLWSVNNTNTANEISLTFRDSLGATSVINANLSVAPNPISAQSFASAFTDITEIDVTITSDPDFIHGPHIGEIGFTQIERGFVVAAELGRITAGTLKLGNNSTGNVNVNESISVNTIGLFEVTSGVTVDVNQSITGTAAVTLNGVNVDLGADVTPTGALNLQSTNTVTTSGGARNVGGAGVTVNNDIGTANNNFTVNSSAGVDLQGNTNVGTGTLSVTGGGILDMTRTTANTLNVTGLAGNDMIRLDEVPNNLNVDGAGGTDTVTYATAAGAVNARGDDYTNVENLIGSANADTVTGPAAATVFTLNGANSFLFNGLQATSFENLTGGGNNDTFAMGPGGGLSGILNGGGGINGINYSTFGAQVTTDLGNSTTTGIGGGFTNLNSFTGSALADTLRVSGNFDDTFTITSNNGGTVNTPARAAQATFASYENLNGGNGTDHFQFNNQASLSGQVDGGNQPGVTADTLTVDDSNLTTDERYTIEDGKITRNPTYDFVNIEAISLMTGTGDDTVTTDFFSFAQSLDAGAHSNGDILNFDVLPFGTPSPVSRAGLGTVTFGNFELFNFQPQIVQPAIIVQAVNTVTSAAPVDPSAPITDPGGGAAIIDPGNNGAADNLSGGGSTTSSPPSGSTSSSQLMAQVDNNATAANFAAGTSGTSTGPAPGGGLFSSGPSQPATSVTPSQNVGAGPVSLGGGPPASTGIQTQMTASTSPATASAMSTTLGGDGTVPLATGDGSVSMDVGDDPTPPSQKTNATLGSGTGPAAQSELSLVLGGDGSVGVTSSTGPTSMSPGGPPPSQETQQSLTASTNPQTASAMSIALGGDGTAPVDSAGGAVGVDPSSPPPNQQTQTSMNSSLSAGAMSELSGSLGGSGEVIIYPETGIATVDPSGLPLSNNAQHTMSGSTGARTEASLSNSMGLNRSPVAGSQDGPIGVDLDGTPDPATTELLEISLSSETQNELEGALLGK